MYYTIQKGSCVHSNLTRKEVKLRRNNSNDNCNSFYEPCLLQQQSLSACPEEDYCQNRGQCLLKSSVRFSQIEILNKRAIKTLQKYLEFSIFFKSVKFQGRDISYIRFQDLYNVQRLNFGIVSLFFRLSDILLTENNLKRA